MNANLTLRQYPLKSSLRFSSPIEATFPSDSFSSIPCSRCFIFAAETASNKLSRLAKPAAYARPSLSHSLLRTREPTPVISPSSLLSLPPSSVSLSRRANHPPVTAASYITNNSRSTPSSPRDRPLLPPLSIFTHEASVGFAAGEGGEVEKIDEKS